MLKSNRVQLNVLLLPDIIDKSQEESVLLVVSIKILKNRLPEYKYEAHTTATLCGDSEVLTETPQGKYCFKDHKDDISFTMAVASQEAVKKNTSSELKLSIAVQVHELTRGDVSYSDTDEDDFMLVNLRRMTTKPVTNPFSLFLTRFKDVNSVMGCALTHTTEIPWILNLFFAYHMYRNRGYEQLSDML